MARYVPASLFEALESFRNGKFSLNQLVRYSKTHGIEELKNLTSFIDTDSLEERLYYVVNDLTSVVTCPYCGKKCTFSGRVKDGYRPTCGSEECKKKNFAKVNTVHNQKANSNKKTKFFEILESLEESTIIDDELIKNIFFGTKGLNRTYFSLISEDHPIYDYLINRFKDSSSIEETLQRIKLGIEEKPKCPLCGNPVTFIGKPSKMFSTYCGTSCSAKAPEVVEKKKETQFKHWGTRNCYDSSIYQNHLKETLGVSFHTQRKEIKEKRKQTLLEHYGTTKIHNLTEIKEKTKTTNIEKYGYENPMQSPEIKNKKFQTTKDNNSFQGGTSKQELIIRDYLKQYFPDLIWQYKSEEYPFNCDFYIPKINLYIEFNGSVYHHGHFFDNTDENDNIELAKLKKKNTKFYDNIIKIWTITDPMKKQWVENNNIKMVWIWGEDYINGLEFILNKIIDYIKNHIDSNYVIINNP